MKYAVDMDYQEFINWAVGYILMGIGEGRALRDLVHTVIDQAVSNKVFGKGNR